MKEEFAKLNQETKPNLLEKLKTKFGKDFLIAISSMIAFVPLSTQESEAQAKIKPLTQKEIKIDIKTTKEFEEQKEFMLNWYSNRVISYTEFQKKFEEIKPKIIENLKKISLKEDTIPLFNDSGIRGIAMNKNDTLFVDLTKINDKTRNTAIVHELGHQVSPQIENKTQMPDWMIELINNAVKESAQKVKNIPQTWNTKDTALISKVNKYFRDPDEIYARICVLREIYFLPTQFIKINDLENVYSENNGVNIKSNWNINNLLGVIEPSSLIDLLNKLP